jgi:hypothetical protein
MPDVEASCCLGSEGNGVNFVGGGEGGPERGKDKQSMLSKGGDNKEKEEEEQSSRT